MNTAVANDRQQLVDLARKLERRLAQRRKAIKRVTDLDQEIRQLRKFVNDLTLPDVGWPERPLDASAP